MRICYISYVKYGAGSWVHTSQFISSLKSIHHDVVVYTPRSQKINVHNSTAKVKPEKGLGPFRELRFLSVVFTRRLMGELCLIKRWKPDVVILRWERYLSSILLCRLLKIPIIVEINGPALEDHFSPKAHRFRGKQFWQWFEKTMMRLPDHIMVVSDRLKQYYTEIGISPQKMTSVPNGVDAAMFNPEIKGSRIREKLGLKHKTVIGFSGNFAPWHGLDFLAEAMKNLVKKGKHDNLVLLLIGKPGTKVTMPDLPENITIITGHIPHQKMPEYLAAIDIFVAPYPLIRPFYFSPLKIFEAMAMGKPVLASAQGQICQLITDRVSGLLYPPDDQSAFLRKLELLISDKNVRQNLGQNARQAIEQNYTWKDNACNILNLCKKFVKK